MTRGRCQDHARQRDKQINRVGSKVYRTKRWAITRRKKLTESPICETPGCRRFADTVHHITDLAEGGAPYDPSNLQSLCSQHHSRITKARQLAA